MGGEERGKEIRCSESRSGMVGILGKVCSLERCCKDGGGGGGGGMRKERRRTRKVLGGGMGRG